MNKLRGVGVCRRFGVLCFQLYGMVSWHLDLIVMIMPIIIIKIINKYKYIYLLIAEMH